MTTMVALSGQRRIRNFGWLAVCTMAAVSLGAQTPAPRIRSEVSSSQMSSLKGSLLPKAQPQFDAGRMPSDTRLTGMSIYFNRSAAQDAALKELLAAQQNPASPLYHQWLTPEAYAARFGMAQADLDKVELWLQQQGFAIDYVARGKNMIRFSGTVGQVEQAFQTQMHFYNEDGVKHFAPSTALSLPVSIAATIADVGNLNDFRPKPQYMPGNSPRFRPGFTSSVSGNVFYAPGDIKIVYDYPATGTGNTGVGQSIAIAGQSEIVLKDIENFQNAAGLPVKDPTEVLVPNSGTAALSPGDEGESDLDLEWSGASAPGASIFFVYTGNSTNYNVFDSVQYAVDQKLANIISVSYGACETSITTTQATALEAVMSQGASQGQTIIASSGDQGSTSCNTLDSGSSTSTSLTVAQQQALAVNYPASSQFVVGVGGTEIPSADENTTTGYFTAASGSDVLTSAIKYVPEISWNDDTTTNCTSSTGATVGCLSASGGGASALFTKPTWQTGVPGIPSDGKRDVPDVALYSSPNYPGYLYCTSDQSDWNTTVAPVQTGSCGSGFRASSTDNTLTVAGGTSFAAPIFAGMVAIINQAANYTTGQGLLNTALYSLASNSTTYGAAFHDVTSGNNFCTAGTFVCGTTTGFSAGTGYDQVTGLGSVDLGVLVGKWSASASTLIPTTTTLSAASATPNVNTADVVTITVASTSGTTIPSGNVTLQIDGGTAAGGTTVAAQPISTTGTLSYTANFTTTGIHQIIAQYAGDATHAASTGAVQLTVGGSTSGTPGIKVAASPSTLTVKQGTSGTETITVTPAGGYTGTVDVSFTSSNNSALTNLCYQFAPSLSSGDGQAVISGTASASVTLNLDTNAADCANTGYGGYGYGYGFYAQHPKWHRVGSMGGINTSRNRAPSPVPAGVAFAGLLLAGFLGRRSRNFRNLMGVLALLVAGMALSACGGGATGVSNPPKGTYTMTIKGVDTTTKSITNTTTFTFVID